MSVCPSSYPMKRQRMHFIVLICILKLKNTQL
jgi:hypothetical protein